MGMKVTLEQSDNAAGSCVEALNDRFSGSGVESTVEHHSNAFKMAFVRIDATPQHWLAVAKFMKFDLSVNYCSMVTGTHYPDGPAERGWEVAYHMMRMPVSNVVPHTNTTHIAENLSGDDIPMEFEVRIAIEQGDSPTVPSIQSLWVGADWNEKETWDLVGINFEGHKNMHRVLNPHDSPDEFHPLQKQHKLRYHGHNEMYDDAQGFGRKPADEGRNK